MQRRMVHQGFQVSRPVRSSSVPRAKDRAGTSCVPRPMAGSGRDGSIWVLDLHCRVRQGRIPIAEDEASFPIRLGAAHWADPGWDGPRSHRMPQQEVREPRPSPGGHPPGEHAGELRWPSGHQRCQDALHQRARVQRREHVRDPERTQAVPKVLCHAQSSVRWASEHASGGRQDGELLVAGSTQGHLDEHAVLAGLDLDVADLHDHLL